MKWPRIILVIATGLAITLICRRRMLAPVPPVAETASATAARAPSGRNGAARRERPSHKVSGASLRLLDDPAIAPSVYDEESLHSNVNSSDPGHCLAELIAAGKFAEAKDWMLSRHSGKIRFEATYLWHAWATADRDGAAAALADRSMPVDATQGALQGIFSSLYQSPDEETVSWIRRLASGFGPLESSHLYRSVAASWVTAGVVAPEVFSSWMDHFPPEQKAVVLTDAFGSSLGVVSSMLIYGRVSRGWADLLNSRILDEVRQIQDPAGGGDGGMSRELTRGLASIGCNSGQIAATLNRLEPSFTAYDLPSSLIVQSNFAAGLGMRLRGNQDVGALIQLATSDELLGPLFWRSWVEMEVGRSDPLLLEERIAAVEMPGSLAQAAGETLGEKIAGRGDAGSNLDSLPEGPFREELIGTLIHKKRALGQPTVSLEAMTAPRR